MVTVGLTEFFEHRLARQVLKAGCGIDQASIKENPTARRDYRRAVRKRHRDRAAQKGCRVHPRQRQAITRQLVFDDPPSRLSHDSVAVGQAQRAVLICRRLSIPR